MIESNATFGISTDAFIIIEQMVVLMMENRPFDKLLSNLFSPSDLASSQQFAGLKYGDPYYDAFLENMHDGHVFEKVLNYVAEHLSQLQV